MTNKKELSNEELNKVAGGASSDDETNINRLVHIINDLTENPVDSETRLSDTDLDSLDLVDMAQTIEEEFGIIIDYTEISFNYTVRQLYNFVIKDRLVK